MEEMNKNAATIASAIAKRFESDSYRQKQYRQPPPSPKHHSKIITNQLIKSRQQHKHRQRHKHNNQHEKGT
jgi:hypothetical protein